MLTNNLVVEVATFLRCPDDGSTMALERNGLQCNSCSRRFQVRAGNFIEMLPAHPFQFSASASAPYKRGYLEAFWEPFSDDPNALAWGSAELASESWIRKRLRQVRRVDPIIKEEPTSKQVLCDVAAGAGHYTLAYASQFEVVFHCDLSVTNLNYARRRAQQLGIRNIVFVRSDYFSLPFRQTMDRVLCLDTLIRGEEHDSALLASIHRALAPSGKAVVDFHNWWHNPLRRIGVLPDNFHYNKSYTRPEANKLLRSTGLAEFSYFPFIQEVDNNLLGRMISRFLPPARLIYRFEAGGGLSSEPFVDQLITKQI